MTRSGPAGAACRCRYPRPRRRTPNRLSTPVKPSWPVPADGCVHPATADPQVQAQIPDQRDEQKPFSGLNGSPRTPALPGQGDRRLEAGARRRSSGYFSETHVVRARRGFTGVQRRRCPAPTASAARQPINMSQVMPTRPAASFSASGWPPQDPRRVGPEQCGELPGVDLGVVAVAVVEQHVGLPGLPGQPGDLGAHSSSSRPL